MTPGEATAIGGAVAGILMAAGALYQQWTARRDRTDDLSVGRAQQMELSRQADLDRLYKGLWAQVEEHEATIKELREENSTLWRENGQMGSRLIEQDNKIVYQDRTIAALTARVAELEGRHA